MKPISEKTIDEINDSKTLIQTISNGQNDGFKEFITQRINDSYSWGLYGNFRIVICNADGYVNATQLIKEATVFENERRTRFGKKNILPCKFMNWSRNEATLELVDSLNYWPQFRDLKLIKSVKGKQLRGEEAIRGAYIHPKLVNSLAFLFLKFKKRGGWSPSYALVVANILEEYHLQAKNREVQMRVQELENVCNKKDDVISEIRELYNSMSKDFKISIEDNKVLLAEVRGISTKLNTVNLKLDETNSKLDTANSKLNRVSNHLFTIAPDIRPKTRQPLEHLLIIVRINANDSGKMTHYAIRTIKRDRVWNVKKISDHYEAFEIVREFESVNSIQIWNRIREECIYIRAKRNFFKLLVAEETVFEDFQRIILSAVEAAVEVIQNN